jgi:hypothetical protein
MEFKMPSFTIQLMKLKYVMQNGKMTAVSPPTFDQWVTLKLTKMTLWREQRPYDSQMKI